MLHVHGVVHRLREAAGNGLCNSKNAIQSLRAKERIVNEVVPHSVDVRINHKRINESETQHHPQRRIRIEEKQSNEISQMKYTGQRWYGIPAGVCEQPGVCRRPFYSNNLSIHSRKLRTLELRYRKVDWQVLKIAKAIPPRLS